MTRDPYRVTPIPDVVPPDPRDEEIERLRAELSDLRLEYEYLQRVRGAGCQCGDDEACAFARDRDDFAQAYAEESQRLTMARLAARRWKALAKGLREQRDWYA